MRRLLHRRLCDSQHLLFLCQLQASLLEEGIGYCLIIDPQQEPDGRISDLFCLLFSSRPLRSGALWLHVLFWGVDSGSFFHDS